MSKPDDNIFRDARRWIEGNGWWLNTILIVAILFLLLNTGQYRNYDTIGLALTTLEVFLIMAAFIGFWLIRREAIAEAKETAEATAEKIVNARFQQEEGKSPEPSKKSGESPVPPSVDSKEAEEQL